MKLTLVLALALSSCGPRGPTAVARGEYYSAGKPEFDSFFIELHRLQVELLSAGDEPRAARRSLTVAAGLAPEASDETLEARLAQELQKLAAQGLRVRLEVPEASSAVDASATLHTSESANRSPWRATLPSEATRLVRSRNRMVATREQLDRLRVVGIQLEGNVDPTFRVEGPWKKSEVTKNLEDGQKLITLMSARAQEVEKQTAALLALLARAAVTDPHLGTRAPLPPTDPAPAPVKANRRPAAAASAGSKATPAAKPATPGKPAAGKPRADDDAPAPKPVQGNAPAEIEP